MNRLLLWTHLGLGDQISMARVLEERCDANDVVFLPAKKRNEKHVREIFSYIGNLQVLPVPNSSRLERLAVSALSMALRARLEEVGHSKLPSIRKNFPGLHLNSQFNVAAGLDPADLVSHRLHNHLLSLWQAPPPDFDYAFVDHHRFTDREIPTKELEEIEKRGLRVVENDHSLPLQCQLEIMKRAKELHMVASAPLCLALTTGIRNKSNIYWDSLGEEHTKSSYPGWETRTL